MNETFRDSIKDAVSFFNSFEDKETIRVISHLDTDGICSGAIILKALMHKNLRYSLSIVPQLTENTIISYSREPYKNYIFTDLGSGQLKLINRYLKDKKILILDHHVPQESEENNNIYHLNPHLHDIDGSTEISGSGVVYLFTKELYKKAGNLAHLAVLGAIGDVQERKGFKGLNSLILKDALDNNKLIVEKGIPFFGSSSRPLYKLLEFCTDPYIPGVSGSESGAIQFLKDMGIEPKKGTQWIKLPDLKEEQEKKLIEGVIIRRANEEKPEDVIGPIYCIAKEDPNSPMRDLKEFSTLLNACGRMDKASVGIGACLGDKRSKVKAIRTLQEYRKELISAMRWIEDNKKSKDIIEKKGYMIINAKDNISSTIIGTVISIMSKSKMLKNNTIVVGLSQSIDFMTKVSIRISGKNKDIDLRKIVKEITNQVGGESGGHMSAAGAIIKSEKEEEFVKQAVIVLDRQCMEERII